MDLSRKIKSHIIAGIIVKEDNKIYNSAVHFDTDGLVTARYDKIHPFSYGDEDKNYDSSTQNVITKIDKVHVGLSVCYDLRFPELYRIYAKERAEILVNIANWPTPRIEHWESLLKARAIENQSFMIGVNRVGNDPYHTYNGCSAVFNPMGEEICLRKDEEELILAELNVNEADDVRSRLPFLNDIKLI